MKIKNVLDQRALLVESQLRKSRKILAESCDGLTAPQRKIVEGIYNDLRPLIEASLSADQIQGIFGSVEKAATAAGGNRTLLGKGIDTAKVVDDTINKIGRWLQDTTPVKNFDQKFEDLKAKASEKFPDLSKKLSAMGDWAKANPGKTAAIIGVLTTIAALAGGPVGGAIAGQILRGSAELLKGEKLSTAIGKGIKTAAYGYIAGWLLDVLGDWLEGIRASVLDYPEMPGLVQIDVELTKSMSGPGWSIDETLHSIVVPADQKDGFLAILDVAKGGDINAFNDLQNFGRSFDIRDYLETKAATDAVLKAITQENDSFLQGMKVINDGIRAAAQGAIAGKLDAKDVEVDGKPAAEAGKQESYYVQTRPLSEGQVYLVFKKIATRELMEGPMDWIKKKAGNLTTKITADKLNSAWKSAGSPMDSDELAAFLEKQGIDAGIVKQVYTDMKIPAPGTGKAAAQAAADFEQVKAMVLKLPVERKARLLKSLLGGAKGMKQQATIDADRERLLPQASEDIK